MGSFWGSKRSPNRFHRLHWSDPGRSGSRSGCLSPFQEGKANDGQASDRCKRASGRGLGPSGGGSWAFWGVFWVLTRLRVDTAERGTSRERHRFANARGKCRVLQCPFNDVQGGLGPSVGGVLGRKYYRYTIHLKGLDCFDIR